MFRTFLSILLVGLLMLGANSATALASQSTDDAESIAKVRLKVAKIGIGDKAKVTVKMKDGTKIKGFITQAGTNDFTVRNKQTGDPTTILYRDVLKLDDNRGDSTTRNILIGVAIGVGVFIAIIGSFIVAQRD